MDSPPSRRLLCGHRVLANYHVSMEDVPDRFIDEPPDPHEPYHLKLPVADAVSSSFGMIVRRRPGR